MLFDRLRRLFGRRRPTEPLRPGGGVRTVGGEDLAAARRQAAEREAAEREAAERDAAERVEAERAAVARAEADRATAERAAAERARADRDAAARAEAERTAAEKPARPVATPTPLGTTVAPKRPPDLPIAVGGGGATTVPSGGVAGLGQKPDGLVLGGAPERRAPPSPVSPPVVTGLRIGRVGGLASLGVKSPTVVATPRPAAVSERDLKNPSEREYRMSDAKSVLAMMKEKDVEYLDLRFTDPRGKMHHVTMEVDSVDEDMFADGVMFDGSSIAGWKAINESDMVLMPDAATAVIDPFYAQNTVAIFCDILEPSGEAYSRDPRTTAKKAMEYLKSTGIGDAAYFGPEAEFFVFDSVRFDVQPHRVAVELDGADMPHNNWTEYETGNLGHRPRVKGGYFPVNPIDPGQDMRSEMLSTMKKMGVPVEKHHHEVASAQHELGFKFGPLVGAADHLQLYKYCIHNVAAAYGKSATFMPKPIKGDNGSGMHVHQSIWREGQPLFAGNQYADLSEECLYYIGGILKHAKALNCFTNPSTNSYKRLIPGFEAPVLLAYSARNRSASCRIPYASSRKGKRVEIRFPDPTANPYLAFTAMMMAGIDGILNKIHPGEPMDKDLYALPPEELKQIPTVCGSLREALGAIEQDHAFLLKGGVFTEDQIEAYVALKWEELYAYEHTPHPIEFDMYYSV